MARFAQLLLLLPCFLIAAPADLNYQALQYNADMAKTIVELQQFREATSASVRSNSGSYGWATLFNLNPTVNSWYLLEVAWKKDEPKTYWHLENPKPNGRKITLDPKFPSGVVISDGSATYSCDLFGASNALQQGRSSMMIYYPLCGGRIYLRNQAKGERSALEGATEFLRTQVWGGEKVIVFFHHLLSDRYRETADLNNKGKVSVTTGDGPTPALVDPTQKNRFAVPERFGIALEQKTAMSPGMWYKAAGNPGTYVSIIQPNLVAPEILESYPGQVAKLDKVEAASLCFLMAFDLQQFDLGFSMGTTYPGVAWSDRVTPKMKSAAMKGPDGIGTVAPLIPTGLIDPENGRKTIAAFAGGFKRSHGAFRFGDLSMRNHGSHYGVVQNGTVLSKLQPGLSTIVMWMDGKVEMKTWTDADTKRLNQVRHARQNGVPLAEFDPATKATLPGKLVKNWGPGNWSGSEDEKLRSIRAGSAIQEISGRRYFIYAVFSSATPSAMTRVFQAYQANYAMLMDMNALEHTYLAYYRRSGKEMSVDHLMKAMSKYDKESSGQIIPRFLGYPDNRDFFYVMLKK